MQTFYTYSYCHLYYIIEIECILLVITPKNLHIGGLEYGVDACASWYSMTGAPLG